jgi:DNA polymerase
MARDLMADAVLRLEEASLPVMFHSHDEVILELDNDASKEEAVKEAERILKTTPEWAEGLPLGIEGSFAESYTK